MISHKLDVVLHEAVQSHAQRYSHGKLDLEKILSAIGELASSYLAQVPHGCERRRLFTTATIGETEAKPLI